MYILARRWLSINRQRPGHRLLVARGAEAAAGGEAPGGHPRRGPAQDRGGSAATGVHAGVGPEVARQTRRQKLEGNTNIS